MADQFRYVINTELKLKAGSLNTLLNDIKDIDKQIKGHFEKAGGGVRVPVTVDKDITKLQSGVKTVVESYNKGQAPHIKIPVSIDESSIRQIQNRINALKNQLNSLSNDKKSINLNTSLKLDEEEKAKIQKQVGDTKASVVVGLRLNEQDIKAIKAQIESIKAEVKATVVSNQGHPSDMRRLPPRNERIATPSNGGRTSGRQTTADAKRDYYESYQYYQERAKAIKSQIKGEQELNRLRSELDRASKSNKETMYGYKEDGKKYKTTPSEYTKKLEDDLKQQETLLRQLKRTQQATEIARQKMAQEPFMTPQAQKSSNKSNSKLTEQQKVQQQVLKAEAERRMREAEQQRRDMERLQARLGEMNRRDPATFHPNYDAIQGIDRARAKSAMDNQLAQAKAQTQALKQQQAEQAKLQAQAEKQARQNELAQQRANDYRDGRVRYGGNKEYSGVDLEQRLKNPNVSLADSMSILNNQIHPANQAVARANNQNFQRAYTINYRDDNGHIQSVRTLTYEYTNLGDKVERGDRSFKALAGNMLRNIGVYTLFTSGFYAMSNAIGQAVQQMIDFDAQLAQVGMITQNLNTGAVSDAYKSFGNGINSIKTNIQNDAFSVGQKYGVSTSGTVLPVESQVLARTNLITGKDGKIDPKMQKQMVDKIIQYSAVSTGGNATAEEVSSISQDVLSLYQAMYGGKGDTSHMEKTSKLLDYMAIMKAKGVNTNAVTDAMSELAPDTIKKGINPKLVAGMLGAYNLSDTDATGANMTQIGKLFFGSVAKPNNPQVQEALQIMGIDTSAKQYNQKELVDLIMKKFPVLKEAEQSRVAMDLAGLTGKSPAMTPKMLKFLEASSSDYVNQFNKADKETPNALEKSWDTFSDTLKRNFMDLGEQLKEFVQQLARLGVMDVIGGVIKGLTGLLGAVNSVLHVLTKLSDAFSDNNLFNIPKMLAEVAGFALAFKGFTAIMNKLAPGLSASMGDWLEGKVGRRGGFRAIEGAMPTVANTATSVVPVVGARTRATLLNGTGSYVASNALMTASTMVPIGSRDVRTINGSPAGPVLMGSRALEQARRAEPTGRLRNGIGSVGRFMNEALMISSIRSGGAKQVASKALESGSGALKNFIGWIGKGFVAMRPFALLLTRLTVIGGVLAGTMWLFNKAVESAKNKAEQDYQKQSKNLADNSKKILNDKGFSDSQNKAMDSFVADNLKFMKDSKNASVMGTDMSSEAIARNERISKGRNHFKDEYGLEFISNGKGDFIKYHTIDGNGKMSKNAITANVNNQEDMDKFDRVRKNGFRGEIATAKDEAKNWEVNTDYVMKYNDALNETNELTKQIGRVTKMLGFNLEGIDAKFLGATSTESLKEKISATQSGIGSITAQRSRLSDIKSQVDTNMSMLTSDFNKQVSIATGKGISQKQITDIKNAYELAKQQGKTDDFMDGYALPTDTDVKKWKKDGASDKEVNSKIEEAQLLNALASIIMKMAGLQDAQDNVTDAYIQNEQAIRQQEQAMKEYTAQLIVASTGVAVMDAKISQINSAVGMGRAMVEMADPNSKEQISAQGSLMKASSQLLQGYRAELDSVGSKMSEIARQNPNQDFSLSYLYNPGENGLTAQQQAYKDLLEKQTQIQDSVSSTTTDVYSQAQQLKDMVLNSDKYADVWERVQNRAQLVKDANKEIFNMKNDLSMVNSLSNMRSAITGQPVQEVRQSKLESIRDRGLDQYEQLMTALNTYKGDAKKLKEAYAEINKTMGSEFDKAFISPLKDLIKNDFNEAGKKILDGADSLNKILSGWAKFTLESASNPDSVAGQTQSFENAMKIPGYQGGGGGGVSKNSSFAEKEQAYLEQSGYKVGTKEYAQAKRQLEASMSHEELVKQVNDNVTYTKSNSAVKDYSKTINGVLTGQLSGYGTEFVKYGAKYGIDPRLMAAIAMSETGGDSYALRTKNNVGGIMGKGGQKSYSSISASIADLARILKEVYFDQGYNTIPEIQSKYAPYNAKNDPNHLNDNWRTNVVDFYSRQTGISKSKLIGGEKITTSSGSSSSKGGTYVQGANKDTQWVAKHYTSGGWGYTSKFNENRGSYHHAGLDINKPGTSDMGENIYAFLGGTVKESGYNKYRGNYVKVKQSDGSYQYYEHMMKSPKVKVGDKVSAKDVLGYVGNTGDSRGSHLHYEMHDKNGKAVDPEKFINQWKKGQGLSSGSGPSFSAKDSGPTALQILKAAISSLVQSVKADNQMRSASTMQKQYYKDATIAYGQGNVRDVLGTSGRLAVADRITQERENVYQQRYDTVQQIKQLQTARKNYGKEYDKAVKSGDKDTAKAYKDGMKSIDSLIKTLGETNKKLGEWDKKLSEKQKLDPRLNYGKASSYIQGGYSKLRSMNSKGETASVDYYRVADEVNQMNSEYMTTAKKASIMGELWNTTGQQTIQYSNIKRSNTQNEINLMFEKITRINSVLGKFAQGTQSWYTTLEDAVAVQKELNDLEKQKLQNASDMFEMTGKGLQGYIRQRAYTQSHDYAQDKKNRNSAIDQYKAGTLDKGYGLKTGTYKTKDSAEKTQKFLKDTYGIYTTITKGKDGRYTVSSNNTLTKSQSESAQKGLKDKKYAKVTSTTGGGKTNMDANQDLATLQIIAEYQDKLINQMNDYRNAVVGAFKAGAISLEEYMKRMNELRDTEVEAKENTIKLVDSIQESFKDAFANALSSGMQGNIDAKQMFIDSMKQSMASAISTAIATALMSASGLTDIVNKFITGAVGAVNSGDPNAIANMFNEDGSLKKDFDDALAPFLPLIDAIVKSTDGMFSIMKDQMFNAPQGFKIDSALYDVLKGMNSTGYMDWDGTGKNEAGSDITGSGGNSGDAKVDDSTTKTNGGDTGTVSSGGTTSTGSSENTTGKGEGKPDSDKGTTTPKDDKKKPKPPAKKSKSKKTYITTENVWEHKSPDSKTSTRIKIIKKGTKVTVDDESHGFLHIGKGKWISAQYAKKYTAPSSKGGSTGGSKGDSGKTKHVKSAVNFRSSAGYGNNIIGTLPKGATVQYFGEKNGWASIEYKGKKGYVGPSYIYHTGGIAGMMNFSSPNGLKSDEINAVLRKGENVFTDQQISSLVGSSNTTNNNGGDTHFNVTVNVDGAKDTGSLQSAVEIAVKKAVKEISRNARNTNLSWKGTTY